MTTARKGNPWFWMLLMMTVPIILGVLARLVKREAPCLHTSFQRSRAPAKAGEGDADWRRVKCRLTEQTSDSLKTIH
jgi:hypothetical protein